MTITTSGRIAFSDIMEEFGTPSEGFSGVPEKDSIGAFRISENVGSLTNLPIDIGVPRSGSPIKFSDFYGKRLNIVVYYTPTNIGIVNQPVGNLNARNTYALNDPTQVRVLGGYTSTPTDPTDKRIIINVNRLLGSQQSSARSSFGDVLRKRCAIRTGNWSATPPASIVMEIGSAAEIYGAGGNGGNAESSANPLPLASYGINGTSAIGIEHPTVVVNRGYIQCGFGGGGAGGWNRYSSGSALSGGGGGGGGAGIGVRSISGSGFIFGEIAAGGSTVNFPQAGSGTDGFVGSIGGSRIAGSGGAGGANNEIIGAGGTGGYFSPSQNGWDLRYARFTNRRLGIGTIIANPEGLFWHPDGVHAYVSGQANFVHRFTTNIPWEVNSLTWDGNTKRFQTSLAANGSITYASGIFLKSDGTRMWIASQSNNRIYQYDLSVPWDISTAVLPTTLTYFQTAATEGTGLQDFWWKPDGSAFYALFNSNDRVVQYDISSPSNYWDIGTSSSPNATFTTGRFFSVSNKDDSTSGLCFKPDGTTMYVAGAQRDRIYQFAISTPWQLNNTGGVTPTAAWVNSQVTLSVVTQDNNPRAVFVRQDNGESLYVVGTQNNGISQYSLSSQYGEGGGQSDVRGGYSGYPGFAFVSTSSTSLTIDPTSTGTIIGLTTIGSITPYF